jgi:hypothetical protein
MIPSPATWTDPLRVPDERRRQGGHSLAAFVAFFGGDELVLPPGEAEERLFTGRACVACLPGEVSRMPGLVS